MAEILQAVLQLDIGNFIASLQQAAQSVTAFANAISGSIGNSAQAFQQQVQAINNIAQATRQATQTRTQAHREDMSEMEELRQEFRLQLVEFQAVNRQELEAVTSRNRLIAEDTKRTAGENVATFRQESAEVQHLAATQRQAMIDGAQEFANDPALNPAQRVEALKQANRLLLAETRQGNALHLKELQSGHQLELQAHREDMLAMEELRQAFRLQLTEFQAINRMELEAVTSKNRLIAEDTKRTSGENIATFRQESTEIQHLATAQRQAMITEAHEFANDPALNPAQRAEALKQANRLLLEETRQGNALRLKELQSGQQLELQAHREDMRGMEEFRQAFRLQLAEFQTINRQELEAVTSRNRLIAEDTKRTAGENVATFRQESAEVQHLAAAQRRAMIESAQELANDPALNPAQRVEALKQANRLILAETRQGNALRLKELQAGQQLELQAFKADTAGTETLFGSMVARIGTSLRTLGGYFAASAIIAIPFQLVAWGKAAVATAMEMQALTATFVAITGSSAKASLELAFLRTTAQRVGVDFLETTKQFRNLEAAARGTSLEGSRARSIFEAVVTATRVMGLSSEQSARALLALEQMISKGTISAEELRKQLAQAIPGSVNIMARALGVGTEGLQKMMKAGTLLAEDVLPRFAAQIQKEFGPGLAKAVDTAQASFARLGNEVRDVAAGMGASILVALKPVIDLVNSLLQRAREAGEAAQKDVARRSAEILAGKPVAGYQGTELSLAEGATAEEEKRGKRLDERIAQIRLMLINQERIGRLIPDAVRSGLEKTLKSFEDELGFKLPEVLNVNKRTQEALSAYEEEYRLLNQVIETREKYNKQTELLDPDSGRAVLGQQIAEAQKRYAASVKEVVELHKSLPVEIQKAVTLSKAFPDIYDSAEKKLAAVKALLGEYEDILKKNPNLRLDPAVLKAEKGTSEIAKAAQDEIDAAKATDKAKKEMAREEDAQREKRLAELRADDKERSRIEQEMQLAITNATDGEVEKKLAALQIKIDAARSHQVQETLITRFGATEREKIYAEEARGSTEASTKGIAEIRKRADEDLRYLKIVTDATTKATKTTTDDFEEETARLTAILQEGIDKGFTIDLAAFQQGRAQQLTALAKTESDNAAKEAAKPWIELGNIIDSTLADAFQRVLTGSKNLFEGIRDAFLNLLAKLAADALTHAIIIPAIVQFLGGAGGSAGLGGGGSLFSGAGLDNGGSAGTGGGAVSSALGLVSAGNSISGALGGPALGLSSAGGFGASLAATEIGTIGASYGSGIGAAYIGQSTLLGELGVGSISAGTVVGGIGAGIATGLILSKINSLLGIHGVANTTLAGAGGGAVAGTFVLPGIGTLIGTVVGAIGGALAGILGKAGKQPEFDITGIQAGRIRYDDTIGMVVEQPFKILSDMHQKLGTDYEEFVKLIDDSINELFQQTIDSFKGATPDIQRALVEPLNSAFGDIAILIRDYPKIGGEKFKDQLEYMLGTDFPKIFQDAANGGIEKFTEAVKKIDPVVKAFSQIIDSLLDDIKELQAQQHALDTALAGNIKSLRESTMSPAEILLARKQEFAGLLDQFNVGDEATKIALAPQIGELATAILDLSKTVLAASHGDITGVQAGIKALQESLYTPTQTMAARQTDLANLMAQFRSGDTGVRTVLTPQITQLALQIMELTKGVNTLAEQQALLADFPAQMRGLTEALFSPAQTFLSQQQQLRELMVQFRGSTSEQQLGLEPQIAQLATTLLQGAKGTDVLGQDPTLLRQTQNELVAILQEVQTAISGQSNTSSDQQAMLQATIERTQTELLNVLREVEFTMAGSIVNAGQQTIQALFATAGQVINTQYTVSGGIITAQYTTTNGVVNAQYDAAGQLINAEYYMGNVLVAYINNTTATVSAWSNALYQIQAALIGQVASVRDTAWYSFTQLQNALWTEIGIAQNEIQLLIASLYHLETVDAAVARALGVLGDMNARLGNPLRIDMAGTIGEQLQRDTLQATQQLLYSQRMGNAATIAMLGKLAFGLSFEQGLGIGLQYTGYQHGGYVPFNMMATLHRGEHVTPEWENRNSGSGKAITIQVYGGNKDTTQIADEVIRRIEQKSGRLQSTTIQTSRR